MFTGPAVTVNERKELGIQRQISGEQHCFLGVAVKETIIAKVELVFLTFYWKRKPYPIGLLRERIQVTVTAQAHGCTCRILWAVTVTFATR
jgi:hypothetical protein